MNIINNRESINKDLKLSKYIPLIPTEKQYNLLIDNCTKLYSLKNYPAKIRI